LKKSCPVKYSSVPSRALLAPVSYRTADGKRPDKTGEHLILPAATDMVTTLLGQSTAKHPTVK
jgi:hypothetical protein